MFNQKRGPDGRFVRTKPPRVKRPTRGRPRVANPKPSTIRMRRLRAKQRR